VVVKTFVEIDKQSPFGEMKRNDLHTDSFLACSPNNGGTQDNIREGENVRCRSSASSRLRRKTDLDWTAFGVQTSQSVPRTVNTRLDPGKDPSRFALYGSVQLCHPLNKKGRKKCRDCEIMKDATFT
jgi:hypothetical protein